MARNSDIAVLDIGSRKVSVLIGDKNEKGIYNIKGIGQFDYAGYACGKWYDEDSLKKAVSGALKIAEVEAGVKVRKLYIGVPAEFLAVNVKEVTEVYPKTTRITDTETDRLFRQGGNFETDAFTEINCSPVYYTLDGSSKRIIEPRGATVQKLSGLLSYILCENTFINLFDSIAEELKLKEVEYVATPWAEALGLISAEQRDKYAIIMDIGYISSSVAVIRGDGLLHLSSFSIGGGHIAGDIFQALDLPFQVCCEIQNKIDLNLVYSVEEYHEVNDNGTVYRAAAEDVNYVTRERLEEIAGYIRQALDICKFDCPVYAPVYLTGGGITFIRGAKEYISASINRKLEILAPSLPRYNTPAFASLMGLFEVAVLLNGKSGTNFIKKLIAKIGG